MFIYQVKYKQAEPVDRIVEEVHTERLENPGYWVARVLDGLPVAEFDALRAMLGLTVETLAAKVGISTATLARRRADQKPLDRDHGDRIIRYARLYWKAVDFFEGGEAAARSWLASPAPALSGQTPLDFAETEIGAREVEDLLGRLEYGVYA
ncbi:MAG: DUF2384 domain-containing protein [Puniceicoccaceae bacterium]|nr:MAG: DUF2384 domain-containing protein [Puniceicoccaceae bacterium]